MEERPGREGLYLALATVLLLAALLAAAVLAARFSSRQPDRNRQGHGCTDQPVVALSFDDGPDEPYTSQIAAVLDRAGVRATFFQVGEQAMQHPEVTARLLAAGNVVGVHSFRHRGDLASLSQQAFDEDTAQAVAAFGQASPSLYRAPYGRMSPTMRRVLAQRGLTEVGWSLDPKDWSDPGVDEIVRRVVDGARPGDIVLLHDGKEGRPGGDRSQTVAALPAIIEGLRERGFRFVTAAEMLGVPPSQGAAVPAENYGCIR